MMFRIVGATLLVLVCCAQMTPNIEKEKAECRNKGGVPHVYLREFSLTKAEGVECMTTGKDGK